MISISTPTYDLDGARVFSRVQQTDLTGIGRRVTRTATLDCSVVIYDGGYCDGDRTIKIIQSNPTDEDVSFATYITRYYSLVCVSCEDGCFVACPESMGLNRSTGDLEITLLVKERLDVS